MHRRLPFIIVVEKQKLAHSHLIQETVPLALRVGSWGLVKTSGEAFTKGKVRWNREGPLFSLAFSNGNALFRWLKTVLLPSFSLSYVFIYSQMLSSVEMDPSFFFFLKAFKMLSFKNLICED